MIDVTLNTNQSIIAITIVLYIIVTSFAINRYHELLKDIRKLNASFKLKIIDEAQHMKSLTTASKLIKKSKFNFYSIIVGIGACHIFVCLWIHSHIFSAVVPLLIFLFILFVNYWLRGSGVSNSIKNLPGTSQYRKL